MKRILLLLTLAVISQASASAQAYLYTDAYLYADPGSGSIYAQAYSVIYAAFNTYEGYSLNASVQGSLTPTGNYVPTQTNNCGQGCATYSFYAQVPYLGVTLTLNSYHQGWGYIQNSGSFFYNLSSYRTQYIPSQPYLSFTQIDARNPNQTIWRFSGGNAAYQVNFHIAADSGCCGVFQFTNGQYAQTDQAQYAGNSWSTAYLTGTNYGINFNGQSCRFVRQDNWPFTGSTFTTVAIGGEGIVPQTVNVGQNGVFSVSKIQYYDGCYYLVYPGSLTTRMLNVSDSIDTRASSTNTPYFADADIRWFVPTAYYPPTFSPISLPHVNYPTFPAQEARYQTNGYDFTQSSFWMPSTNSNSTMCPSTLWLGNNVGAQAVFLPCWYTGLP